MLLIKKQNPSSYQRDPTYETLSLEYHQKTCFPKNFFYAFSSSYRYRLVFFLQGKATLYVKGKKIQAKKYDCLFLPRNERLETNFAEETQAITITFDFQGVLPFPHDEFAHFEHVAELKELFLQICDMQRFAFTMDGANEATVLLILHKLQTFLMASDEKISLYRKCCVWAEENAHRAVSVKELADFLGYSAEHLNRIIRPFCRMNLAELLIKKRIEKIQFFASEGNYSVKELAKLLDFYSPELLRKFYRYHTGKNLTEYTKKRS